VSDVKGEGLVSEQEVVYGLHAVQALLKSAPQRLQEILLLKGRQDQRVQKIVQAARLNDITITFVTRRQLDECSNGNHQGVVAIVAPGELYDETYLRQLLDNLDSPPFLLALDGVTDPHNLGACLRSAEAAGVQAVIVPKDKSAGLSAIARKVACGAADVLPLIPVTNLSRTLQELQKRGIWITGTAGETEQTIYQADLTGPLLLVMGAEGKGLRRLTREHCDNLAKIPMSGTVSSLNVSVATGVCLFEAVRQRGG
jgi:23S rRNA (guanosine2251-2'-O)-methyltransferase